MGRQMIFSQVGTHVHHCITIARAPSDPIAPTCNGFQLFEVEVARAAQKYISLRAAVIPAIYRILPGTGLKAS